MQSLDRLARETFPILNHPTISNRNGNERDVLCAAKKDAARLLT